MKARVLILAHGAGGSRDTPIFKDISTALSDKSTMVVRFNFPYRIAGKKAPDSPKILLQAWKDAIEFSVKKCTKELEKRGISHKKIKVAIGGRSMGARIASLIAEEYGTSSFKVPISKSSEISAEIDRCVFLSYPLHAPGKKERKDSHFINIHQKCIFISGNRDAFGTPREIISSAKNISGQSLVEILDGGDHELKTRKSDEFTQDELNAQASKLVTLFV